jgi:hypothetical protein
MKFPKWFGWLSLVFLVVSVVLSYILSSYLPVLAYCVFAFLIGFFESILDTIKAWQKSSDDLKNEKIE